MELAEKFEQLQEYCYLLEKTLDKQKYYISELEAVFDNLDELKSQVDDLEMDVERNRRALEFAVSDVQDGLDNLTDKVGRIEERMEDGD